MARKSEGGSVTAKKETYAQLKSQVQSLERLHGDMKKIVADALADAFKVPKPLYPTEAEAKELVSAEEVALREKTKGAVTLDQAMQDIDRQMRLLLNACVACSSVLSKEGGEWHENLGWGLNDSYDLLKEKLMVFFNILDEPNVWQAILVERGPIEKVAAIAGKHRQPVQEA